ncbi:cornifelin homolog A-like isoform X2 [Pleurodeles waltl]|uniref:cornifelin homolog A-like isoform X2 n=1 Tax=Pleurodeles waltl TaxID=8319 RepID=UPI003709C0AB
MSPQGAQVCSKEAARRGGEGARAHHRANSRGASILHGGEKTTHSAKSKLHRPQGVNYTVHRGEKTTHSTEERKLHHPWRRDHCTTTEERKQGLCGTFVPCILMCKVSRDFGEHFCLPCLPGSFLALQTAMRERWHIEGSICRDFFCQCFCGHCVLCQMARELKMRQ